MKKYERVDIVYIRHHTIAKIVDEDEFYHSRETGGTIVSPALELMYDTIMKDYPTSSWNVFGCQASDGDNWSNDCPVAQDVLANKIMNLVQYFAYVEIAQHNRGSDLWPYYEDVKLSNDNFDMTTITDVTDIYPVFRKLFERKG